MLMMLMLCQRCHYRKFEYHNFWKIQIRTIREHIEDWVYKFQLIAAAHALHQLCMEHIHIFPRRSYARWFFACFPSKLAELWYTIHSFLFNDEFIWLSMTLEWKINTFAHISMPTIPHNLCNHSFSSLWRFLHWVFWLEAQRKEKSATILMRLFR